MVASCKSRRIKPNGQRGRPAKPRCPLTAPQRDLAAANFWLVGCYTRRYRLTSPPLELDDLESRLAVALCEAAQTYVEADGPFRIWARWRLRNEVARWKIYWLAACRHCKAVSLAQDDDGPLNPDLIDPADLAAIGELVELCRGALRRSSCLAWPAVARHMTGATLDEVAREFGATRLRARQIEEKAVRRLRRLFGEGEREDTES